MLRVDNRRYMIRISYMRQISIVYAVYTAKKHKYNDYQLVTKILPFKRKEKEQKKRTFEGCKM